MFAGWWAALKAAVVASALLLAHWQPTGPAVAWVGGVEHGLKGDAVVNEGHR